MTPGFEGLDIGVVTPHRGRCIGSLKTLKYEPPICRLTFGHHGVPYDAICIIIQVREITSDQIRAARASLGWSVREISVATRIGVATLKRYEASEGVPKSRKGHLQRLRAHFESAGIEFIGTPDDRPGIRIGLPKHGSGAS